MGCSGDVCMCGNTLDPGAVAESASSCNVACDGDDAETCGSSNCVELYTVDRGVILSSSSSISSSTTPGNPGSITVVGGSTQVYGGTPSVVGGTTEVVDGSTSVLGGTTEINGGSTSVIGGTTEVYGSSTSDLGGSTVSSGSTEGVGGSSSVVGETTEANGGSTQSSTLPPASATGTGSVVVTVSAPDATATLLGGFAAPAGDQLLVGAAVQNVPFLTLESCADVCADYAYFGVTAGRAKPIEVGFHAHIMIQAIRAPAVTLSAPVPSLKAPSRAMHLARALQMKPVGLPPALKFTSSFREMELPLRPHQRLPQMELTLAL